MQTSSIQTFLLPEQNKRLQPENQVTLFDWMGTQEWMRSTATPAINTTTAAELQATTMHSYKQ